MAVGINANGIQKIKSAMEDYRKDIYIHNNIAATNAKLTAAFKGTNIESQVKSLAKQVVTEIDNSMQTIMKDFESKISNVAENYKKNDLSESVVSEAIKSIKS